MSQRPLLSAFLNPIQECPRCHCCVNVEHVGFDDWKPPMVESVAMIWCESCGVGFDVLYRWDGGTWRRCWDTRYDASKLGAREAFRKRLEHATRVAA